MREMEEWQREWDDCTKGRWAYEWLPQVGREGIPRGHKVT